MLYFKFEDKLPHAGQGVIENITAIIACNKKYKKDEHLILIGKVIFKRNIKNEVSGRITKIEDQLPLEVTIPINRLAKGEQGVLAHFVDFNHKIEGDYIKVSMTIELTNISEFVEQIV